uniref:Uncharacterized protein n=1 Tax=Chromera velia CCMP2878 TaxID=1169474 RepID=A0A0G4F735_9ALVE|eukprot:Cvel_15555.t1-p1 / transcript=Cvel_15555.t1 / gene=Cvel_15555 / organism=Chromera_velia_CCMP2878 / gene_product=hypothetical protein / transcript_product=hypothetical protein / location=Cvel_scaffold1156:27072-29390(-) / protein_length=773 / sequence_SO=supercontig / SO=protein_coding / is_pseudo=false
MISTAPFRQSFSWFVSFRLGLHVQTRRPCACTRIFSLLGPSTESVSRVWGLRHWSASRKPSTFPESDLHQVFNAPSWGSTLAGQDATPALSVSSPVVHNNTKRKKPSLRQRREIESFAVSRLRHCLQASDGFEGLEEPPLPLHPFAHADLAVRPTGCTEDQWLPVQVKSTSRQVYTDVREGRRRSPLWHFQKVSGYEGMALICMFVPQGSLPLTERAWLFPGDRFNTLKKPGWLGITGGGKYDKKENRCSLSPDCMDDSHVGQILFAVWNQARLGNSSYKLQDLQTLQTQLSPTHLAEWTMMQKCRSLFENVPCGLQIRDAPCPTLPHDIELRLATWTEWVRVQLKSAYSVQKMRCGLGYVSTKRQPVWGSVPYSETDFDFLLVSPPQNETAKSIDRRSSMSSNVEEDRWRFFYLIPTQELVRDGIVSSREGTQKGLQTITLDFSTKTAEQCRGRPARLHKWKIDTFNLHLAGKQIAEVLSFERGRQAESLSFKGENRNALEASIPLTVGKHSRSIPAFGQVRKITTFDSQGQVPSNTKSVVRRSHHWWETERSAVSLLRTSLQAAGGFRGLEESSVPLPPFARADLAVRPLGCPEDLWLPVQVKSATRLQPPVVGKGRASPTCLFEKEKNYDGMLFVCISLQKDLQDAPRVWIFPIDHIAHLRYIRVTVGGKHDREEFRCSFGSNLTHSRHVGQVLQSTWYEAREGRSLCKLQPLHILQTQLGPAHLTEWRMLQKCLELFETVPGGLEVREALCPSLPYDIEIRLSGCVKAK